MFPYVRRRWRVSSLIASSPASETGDAELSIKLFPV